MKNINNSILAIAVFLFTHLQLNAAGPQNVDDGVGLHGYDPVSYFQNGPEKGTRKYTAEHDGVIYHFSNEGNKNTFIDNPSKFAPQYGGHCAYAMLEGDLVDVDPKKFKIIDDKLYVFYNGFFADTLKKWNKQATESSDTALVSQADIRWQEHLN